MQLINLARAFNMLELPHPLLPRAVDFHGIGRGTIEMKINHRAPGKHDERNTQGNHRPGYFQDHGAVNGFRLGALCAAIADGKVNHQSRHQHSEEKQIGYLEKVQIVHLPGHVGGALGE